jgi:hypothetical protein
MVQDLEAIYGFWLDERYPSNFGFAIPFSIFARPKVIPYERQYFFDGSEMWAPTRSHISNGCQKHLVGN